MLRVKPELSEKSDRELLEEIHADLQQLRTLLEVVKSNPVIRRFLGLK